MGKFVIFIVLLLPVFAFGQKKIDLKRKYFGAYEGVIPSYRLESSEDLMFVSEAPIRVAIEKSIVHVKIGEYQASGKYKVLFAAKKYYLLDVTIDGQLATERIMVYKRGKKLSRDGMYPQPVAELKKVK
ncbi:hypothetical protein OAU25_02205 [Crocinitomicaceae bacterium]|nr:hypothetical protein [Crocinitomicaceae bacterium]